MSSMQKPADVTAERRSHWWWTVPGCLAMVLLNAAVSSRTDQGQAQRLGVKYFPAMMLVDPKQGSVRPLSYGFISQDDLAKQFLNVSEDFKPNF